MELKLNLDKLLDKLAERWLFERKSVALYDLILKKLNDVGFSYDLASLRRFRDQEHDHERLLERTILDLGGSPHERTPSQMLVEQEAQAFENIVAETDDAMLLLHVLLDAELQDNASWDLLTTLCRDAGDERLASRLAVARAQEEQHEKGIRELVGRVAREDMMRAGPKSETVRRLKDTAGGQQPVERRRKPEEDEE